MSHLYIFPGIELYFAAGITILLFLRWKATKDKSTFYWLAAFGFYTLYDIIQLIFISQIVVLHAFTYYLMHFLRQTFISLMFVSVYHGIVRLLTDKKLITKVLPITFFALQELLIAYGDFVVRNIEIADKLHVIFFDVPFNLIIALLFFKLYQVNRKRYSLMISLAWLGYAILVPIFFYTEGGIVIYTLSLIPMFVMFLAFLLFYQAPTGEELVEVKPVVEKRLKTKKRYRLKPGHSYLVEEKQSEKAFDIFVDAVMHGIRGLCITRTKPDWIREKYELRKTPVLWMTQIKGESSSETVDPTELEQLLDLIDKFVTKAKLEVGEEKGKSSSVVDKYAVSAEDYGDEEEQKKKTKLIKKTLFDKAKGLFKTKKKSEKHKPKTLNVIGKDEVVKDEPEEEKKEETEEEPKEEHKKEHKEAQEHKPEKKGLGKVTVIGDDEEEKPKEKKEHKEEKKEEPTKPKEEHKEEPREKEHKEEPREKEHKEESREKEHKEEPREKEHKEEPREKEHKEEPREKEHKEEPMEKEHKEEPREKEHKEEPREKEHQPKEERPSAPKKSVKHKIKEIGEKTKHKFHKIKHKVKGLVKKPKPEPKDIPQEEINKLIEEKHKHAHPIKHREPEVHKKPEHKEKHEDREHRKPKYLKKKRKGKITIIGASDEVKKSINHKAYLVLKTSARHRKSIVLIDGLEYLITNNKFNAVKNTITLLKDKISQGESALIVPINPKTLSKQQIHQLRQEFYIFDPKRKNYL